MLANFQSTRAILGQIKKGRNYSLIEDESAIGYLAIDLSDHLFLSKLYILPHRSRPVSAGDLVTCIVLPRLNQSIMIVSNR